MQINRINGIKSMTVFNVQIDGHKDGHFTWTTHSSFHPIEKHVVGTTFGMEKVEESVSYSSSLSLPLSVFSSSSFS